MPGPYPKGAIWLAGGRVRAVPKYVAIGLGAARVRPPTEVCGDCPWLRQCRSACRCPTRAPGRRGGTPPPPPPRNGGIHPVRCIPGRGRACPAPTERGRSALGPDVSGRYRSMWRLGLRPGVPVPYRSRRPPANRHVLPHRLAQNQSIMRQRSLDLARGWFVGDVRFHPPVVAKSRRLTTRGTSEFRVSRRARRSPPRPPASPRRRP